MVALPCRVLLQERSSEIFNYLGFLRTVIDGNASLHLPNAGEPRVISKDLTHTLKANGYLLLYNVVEATMTTAIEDIHEAIRNDLLAENSDLSLDKMNSDLFLQILRRFKVGKKDDFSTAAPLAGRWLVEYWLDDHAKLVSENKNPLASGNLDGRKMLDMAQTYGFAAYGKESSMRHQGLFNAKNKRNDLAHGKVSFLDCGKDIVLNELVSDGVGVIRCLRHYLLAIEAFIAQRGYVFQAVGPIPLNI